MTTRNIFVPERLPNESFEDYKQRRAESHNIHRVHSIRYVSGYTTGKLPTHFYSRNGGRRG